VPEALPEAEEFIKTSISGELSEQVTRIRKLIDGFETPYGMELLATVHWVRVHEAGVLAINDAVKAVHDWNPRKRAIFSKEHIEIAWRRLNDEGWFSQRHHIRKHGLAFE
jgi:hypothetical protein